MKTTRYRYNKSQLVAIFRIRFKDYIFYKVLCDTFKISELHSTYILPLILDDLSVSKQSFGNFQLWCSFTVYDFSTLTFFGIDVQQIPLATVQARQIVQLRIAAVIYGGHIRSIKILCISLGV